MVYNKETQTGPVETEPSPNYEAELRQRITREREAEAERERRDKELEEESVKLDQEIEQEIRGLSTQFASLRPSLAHIASELSEEERASILAAPEFLEFVENSSKIVQRALNDGYDYIRDYTISAESGGWVAIFDSQSYTHDDTGMNQKESVLSVYANSGMKDMEKIGRLRTLIGRQR